MATFQVLTDLPQADQAEIARIQAIASAQRNSVETAFLANRSDYLYNQVILRDGDSNITIAQGRTLPSGLSGFAVGATFINSSTGAIFKNIGTTSSCSFACFALQGDGAPVDYTDGDPVATGEGYASKGAIYTDYTNGNIYKNTGTVEQPTWVQIALVA